METTIPASMHAVLAIQNHIWSVWKTGSRTTSLMYQQAASGLWVPKGLRQWQADSVISQARCHAGQIGFPESKTRRRDRIPP